MSFDDEEELELLPPEESDRPSRLAKVLRKMFVDIYLGRNKDNPSVTARLDRVEISLDRVTRALWAMALVSATALAGTIGQIVVKMLGPSGH